LDGSRPRRRNGSVVWGRGGGFDLGAICKAVCCLVDWHVYLYLKYVNVCVLGAIENASQLKASKLSELSIIIRDDARDLGITLRSLAQACILFMICWI